MTLRTTSTVRWPGSKTFWLFIMGDLVVFSLYFIAYARDNSLDPALFRAGQASLHSNIGLWNTFLLLTSSCLAALAVERLERDARAASTLFIAAAALGVAFLGLKWIEWSELIQAGHTATENRFYLWYFVLTGFHAAHVLVGLLLLGALARILRRPEHRVEFHQGETVACYWHMVDLLWVAIFVLLYLV